MSDYGKHPDFVVLEQAPFNGGAPAPLLRTALITPLALFYVRAHALVPVIDLASYRLHVTGMVATPLSLSLDALRSDFPATALTATLQCAGNRRSELHAVQPIPGESVMWRDEAISTATWEGVPLGAILARAGVAAGAAHAAFLGLDHVEKTGEGFGGSVPLAQTGDVLLAYAMNGEPLPPVHGSPLRAVVPGYVAARSVKWLGSISLQAQPSANYYQQRDYKRFPPHITTETVHWSGGEMLGELETNAMICLPQDGETVRAGAVTLAGYALPGGNRRIFRVEISLDHGQSWQEATLTSEDHPWMWRFWEITLPLPAGTYTVMVRATDSSGYTQPQHAAALWNFKGYMNNAWHQVTFSAGA